MPEVLSVYKQTAIGVFVPMENIIDSPVYPNIIQGYWFRGYVQRTCQECSPFEEKRNKEIEEIKKLRQNHLSDRQKDILWELRRMARSELLVYGMDFVATSYDSELKLLKGIPLNAFTEEDLYRLENRYGGDSRSFLDEYVTGYGESKSINLCDINMGLCRIKDMEWLKSSIVKRIETKRNQEDTSPPDSYYDQLEELENSEEYQSYKAEEEYLAKEDQFYYENYGLNISFEQYLEWEELDKIEEEIYRLEQEKKNEATEKLKKEEELKKNSPDFFYTITGQFKKPIKQYYGKGIPLSKVGISNNPERRLKEVIKKDGTFVDEIELVYVSPVPIHESRILESYLLDYFSEKRIPDREWVVVPPEEIIEKATEILEELNGFEVDLDDDLDDDFEVDL